MGSFIEEVTLSERFASWRPFEALTLVKSVRGGRTLGEFEGVASTEDPDTDGEILDQDGLDWGYFLKHGFFNWDHSGSPSDLLGEPVEIKRQGPVTRVSGVLYLDRPRAREVYETAQLLQKAKDAGGQRQLGFSVEGKTLARDPKNKKRIQKARVNHVAITHQPVNTKAVLDLVKSIPLHVQRIADVLLDMGMTDRSTRVGLAFDLNRLGAEGAGAVRRVSPRLTDSQAAEVSRILRGG